MRTLAKLIEMATKLVTSLTTLFKAMEILIKLLRC